ARALRGPAPAPARSLAVLGFKNLAGRPDAAWISTALAEMLDTELAAGGQLRIVPGEAVARLKSDLGLGEADSYARDSLARIRDNTGARLVIVGSYVPAAGKLRLDVRAQDTGTGELVVAFTETA